MVVIDGYYNQAQDQFYTDSDYEKLIPPSKKFLYKNVPDGRIYAYDGQRYVDASFYSNYDYVNYKGVDQIYTSTITLAMPGHRIIGELSGIDESSVSLSTKLNNTSELTFTINRVVNGNVVPFYGQIIRHNELYIPSYGWFKITEEPEIENDGTMETKTVTAESGEIELQQYDLVDFSINTGDVGSMEMLATDNSYEYNGYYAFHDQVRFHWDTTQLEEAIEEFKSTDGSVDALKDFVETHSFLIHQPSKTNPSLRIGCWRITQNPNTSQVIIDASHPLTEEEKKQGITYPDYTGTEILDMELKREHELSLMWLILHEHGWKVGYVDPYVMQYPVYPDDKIQLADKVGFFEVDSQDCYSFLTQDVAQYFRCIFMFDTERYTVNCYNINNLGYDTNIFLSFRNVQDQLTRSGREDMYTVFHVEGDEKLNFSEINFGDDSISDISYFLNTKHFSDDLIEKYKHWYNYRESKRPVYTQLAIDYRDAYKTAQELYDRVPVDNMEGRQYSTMTEEELLTERAGMIAIKRGIEAEFTDEEGNIDWDALKNSSEWPQYQAITEIILSSPDPENTIYEIQFWEDTSKYPPYGYDFPEQYKQEHPDARLGNIDIAILNKWIIEGHYTTEEMSDAEKLKRINVKNQKEYLDNYAYDFNKYGYMYGVGELTTQLKTLYNNISTLQSTGIDPNTGEIIDQLVYNKYTKYMNAYNSCKIALAERQAEYDAAVAVVDSIQQQRLNIIDDVNITNKKFDFTENELYLLDKYYIHTDYTNNNILITEQYTSEEIINAELQLYHDAMEELYVESHPQYVWTTTQSNLLLMPEFKIWHSELRVGNFIWITFREDYNVKLRIQELIFNPLMIDTQIKINFTSMTQYRSRRNDYTDLLARANATTKNQISSAISRVANNDNTINVDSGLILQLLNSAAFTNYLTNIDVNAGVTVTDQISQAEIRADQITSGTMDTGRLNIPEIISAGQDSIKGIVSQDYVRSFITEDYVKTYINSDYVKSFVTGNYIRGYVNDSYVKSIITNDYVKSIITNDYVKSIITGGYIKGFIDENYIKSIISEDYIKDTVISSISISDLVQDDIALSEDVSIISSDQTPLLTNDGITVEAIPDRVITDPKLNMVIILDEESGKYVVVPIPKKSTETFGSTLSSIINSLVTRITDLETQAVDFEERIAALEGGSEPEPEPEPEP